eukprot:859239-Rhodomonas_salina.2
MRPVAATSGVMRQGQLSSTTPHSACRTSGSARSRLHRKMNPLLLNTCTMIRRCLLSSCDCKVSTRTPSVCVPEQRATYQELLAQPPRLRAAAAAEALVCQEHGRNGWNYRQRLDAQLLIHRAVLAHD